MNIDNREEKISNISLNCENIANMILDRYGFNKSNPEYNRLFMQMCNILQTPYL